MPRFSSKIPGFILFSILSGIWFNPGILRWRSLRVSLPFCDTGSLHRALEYSHVRKAFLLNQELAQTNVRVDAYQKAATQIVNLAFGLLATAALTVIVSSVVT